MRIRGGEMIATIGKCGETNTEGYGVENSQVEVVENNQSTEESALQEENQISEEGEVAEPVIEDSQSENTGQEISNH